MSHLVRNKLGTQFIKSIDQSPVIEMTVERYGKTSGYGIGIIMSFDVEVAIENSVIYGLVDTELEALGDDSGEPVYADSNMYGTVSMGEYTLNMRRMLFLPSGVISNCMLRS